ncbi:hypothetical protein ACFV23_52325, partial [Streptomyces sp. NPDC059627]
MSGDGEQRPGDAARRALRAARGQGAETGRDGTVPAGAPGERAERAPRPGDAARRALRVAAATKEAEQRDAEPEPDPETAAGGRGGAGAAPAASGASAAGPPGRRPRAGAR